VKQSIHNPHDKFFKTAMSDPRVARAFFNFHLPSTVKEIVQLENLKPCKGTFIDARLRESATDMLFSINFAGRAGYLYTLVEHQSTPDKLMPFRLVKYLINIIEHHLNTTNSTILPIVYPLVFYTGEMEYSYSMDLFDLFGEQQELVKKLLTQPFQLVEVNKIPDEKLKQEVWLGIMELCMKHVFARDILPYLQDMLSLIKRAEHQQGQHYVEAALTYLLTTSNSSNQEQFLRAIHNQVSQEIEAIMGTIAQQIEAKGWRKGQNETKQDIASKLWQQGMPLEVISKVTDLAVVDLQKLLAKQAH
jgi:recombination-promoting nuclease RpnB